MKLHIVMNKTFKFCKNNVILTAPNQNSPIYTLPVSMIFVLITLEAVFDIAFFLLGCSSRIIGENY